MSVNSFSRYSSKHTNPCKFGACLRAQLKQWTTWRFSCSRINNTLNTSIYGVRLTRNVISKLLYQNFWIFCKWKDRMGIIFRKYWKRNLPRTVHNSEMLRFCHDHENELRLPSIWRTPMLPSHTSVFASKSFW